MLCAVSETAQSAVAAYDIAGPVPRPICESVDVHGETPTQLAVAGGHLLTANYGSGSVTVLPLAAAGTPQAAGDVLRHEGRGPDSARQLGPHAHQVLPDPSGRWVLSVDLGTRSPRHTRIQSTHPAGRSTDTPVVRRGPAGSRRRGRFRWPGAGGAGVLDRRRRRRRGGPPPDARRRRGRGPAGPRLRLVVSPVMTRSDGHEDRTGAGSSRWCGPPPCWRPR
ncbi:lactonase family protein [Streptomyces sp. NPDC056431]|uniref:lactonase family protein n=1 Tax=Streptomyces sp. NPDC056431 TaxID=3345814 RepID=UPI00367891AA